MEKEIELFLKEKNVLPCILKFDLKGKIERNDHCLEEIPITKIKAIKEEKTTSTDKYSEGDFEYKESFGQASDLSIYFNDVMYQSQINNFHKKKENYSFKIIKKILYTYSIKKEDIVLSKSLINDLEELAEKTCDDKTKAKKLDEIFKKTGYFVPLKVYVGGVFIFKNVGISIEEKANTKLFLGYINRINDEQSNIKGNCNGAIITKDNENKALVECGKKAQLKDDIITKNTTTNVEIIGGDSTLRDYKNWENSLNISNAQVIDYTSTVYIYDCFDSNLKKKLEKPLEILEEKYEIRKKYFEKIKELDKSKANNKILSGDYTGKDWESGITQEMDKPKIYSRYFERKSDGSWFGRIKLDLQENFEDIIVGYKITSRWRDGTNGWWKLKENPILTKNIDITFISQVFRGERFDINVYLMKSPE